MRWYTLQTHLKMDAWNTIYFPFQTVSGLFFRGRARAVSFWGARVPAGTRDCSASSLDDKEVILKKIVDVDALLVDLGSRISDFDIIRNEQISRNYEHKLCGVLYILYACFGCCVLHKNKEIWQDHGSSMFQELN